MPFTIDVNATSAASPDAIFRHLVVTEAWNVWGRPPWPLRAVRERSGTDEPDGVGAVRRIGLVREETVAYEPPGHYGYVMNTGLPVRDYRSDVTLEPSGDGRTAIRWQAGFEPKVPGTGPLLRAFGTFMLGRLTKRLATHAERCTPTCPASPPPA